MTIIQPHPIPQWLYDEVEEYFISLPFEPKTILDIGANIGAFAQRAHVRWPHAHVFCCEPMPFNVFHLRRNVPLGTTILSAAIREHSGVDEIYIGDNFVTGGFMQLGRQTQQRILVECVAAKELPSCELVKIDTEGCEVEILENLCIENTRAIFLEYHSPADAQKIIGLLTPNFDLVRGNLVQALGTLTFVKK